MRQHHFRTHRQHPVPHGFTMVEMLVSVALVLLMMSLFASIFSMASNSVSTQRGISLNDQKARALTTMIRADLHHRTMRYPQPFYPGENSATSPTSFGNRSGYLYISTNDPNSGLDDLIQFTVSSDILIEDTDSSPWFGRAQMLVDRVKGSATSLSINTNQPEADDGSLLINSTGSSTAAEVCYFVRNGNLYRRVSLLRDPLPVAGRQLNEQPTTIGGAPYFGAADGLFQLANGGLSDDFWRHFDYSAYPARAITPSARGVKFNGVSALNNEVENPGATLEALGNPRFRFGFNTEGTGVQSGLSREHTAPGGYFLGRFLHAETSASNFNWPQAKAHVDGDPSTPLGTSGSGNPMNVVDVPLNLNTATGLVTEFSESVSGRGRGGPRRMEDLLLSNVHELKIEIWDERLQKYTTPGHSEQVQVRDLNGNLSWVPGDYHMERRYADSDAFGPEGQSLGVFDTWHPKVPRSTTTGDHPPLIAYRYTPPMVPNGPTRPDPPGGATVSVSEPDRQTRRADNQGYWQPDTEYQLGDVVFAPWDDTRIRPADGVFQYDEIAEPKFQIAYRCVGRQGTFRSHPTLPPAFPTSPGRRVREANDQLEWESIDNRRPLSSIRMTLRFMDQTSNTQRTLTLILSLTDKE